MDSLALDALSPLFLIAGKLIPVIEDHGVKAAQNAGSRAMQSLTHLPYPRDQRSRGLF
jgi:hypothetical protein